VTETYDLVDLSLSDVQPLRRAVLRPWLDTDAKVESLNDHVDGAAHFGVRFAGEVVAIGSISPQAHPSGGGFGWWRLRMMAVHPDFAGKGLGSVVLDACIRHAAEQGGVAMWANARMTAVGFYMRNGWLLDGQEFIDDEAQLPHVRMTRMIGTVVLT
jgi:GNAT superfamily N-acetyltransferase